MNRPNFFIAGAPKCGTSSLHDYLAQHPDVYMSEEMKEPGFFNPDLRVNLARRAGTEEKYLRLFRDAGSKRRVGESSTWYMMSQVAAQLINSFDPAAKAILMLRNPVDAMYSLHGQLLWSCNEQIEDFELAVAAEEKRREGKWIAKECTSPDALQYTTVFTYAPQVKRFFEKLGRERVKVIVFDDFVKETARVYGETVEFLDLEPFGARFEVVNAAKPVSPGFNRFLARRPTLRNVVHKLVPVGVQRTLIRAMPFVMKTVERPGKVEAEVRRRLAPRFRDDVGELSEMLGRDLSHWLKVA